MGLVMFRKSGWYSISQAVEALEEVGISARLHTVKTWLQRGHVYFPAEEIMEVRGRGGRRRINPLGIQRLAVAVSAARFGLSLSEHFEQISDTLDDAEILRWRVRTEHPRRRSGWEPAAKHIFPLLLFWRDDAGCHQTRLLRLEGNNPHADLWELLEDFGQPVYLGLVNLPQLFLKARQACEILDGAGDAREA